MAHLFMKLFLADFQLIIIECFLTEPSETLHEATVQNNPHSSYCALMRELCLDFQLSFHSYQ